MNVPHLHFRCYAKINLTLEVVRRRADGYHEVASLIHTISLADELHIGSATQFVVRADGLDIDADTNLVSRAAQLLASTTHVRPDAELSLRKRIPIAAGLGGGSSDAATTLIGLNTLWGTRVGPTELTRLAAELGSDVPFFIHGGAALMRGRGEDLEVLPRLVGQWLVVVLAPHDVRDKTRRLYAALEPADFSAGELTQLAADRLRQHLPLAEEQLTNAFSRAARALFPGLVQLWSEAETICGRRFFLSGAGPALFALAADRADAHNQQARLARRGLPARHARTVSHARTAIRFAADPAIRYP